MIVVDTNVLAYLWLPGDHTVPAEQLWQQDPEWVAPLLWRSEFRSVLSGYLRRGRVSLEVATRIMNDVEDQMRGREYSVASSEVLRLVAGSSCSAYDCEFVALATALAVPFVTSDVAVLRAFPGIARSLERAGRQR